MRLLMVWVAAAAALAGEDRAAAARAAMEGAAARQRAAVSGQDGARAAMEESVARQLAAVARQVRTAVPEPLLAESPCPRLAGAEADAIVAAAATRGGLEPNLLRAVMERESGFRPCAVSPKGAMGLMQLMPGTASDLGVRDVFDPVENAGSGARFLAGLLSRYGGDLELALGAYNAGPARVDAAGGVPEIPETRAYVRAILGRLGIRPSD